MAPLSARRLAEQVALGERVAAVELAVAAQAAQLRGRRLGSGTAAAVKRIREVVPYLDAQHEVPDVEPLVALVRMGAFAGSG